MNRITATLLSVFAGFTAFAQNNIVVFDKILYYDGYATVVTEPVPAGVIRHRNDLYAIKLTDQQLGMIGDTLTMAVTIKASCDNYDRIGNVNLALVPKGAATYDPETISRIELGRFITPFMNKNIQPDTVPYRFSVNNVSALLRDAGLIAQYDFWMELEVFGVPYAANNEVAGCSGRNDVFFGSLRLETGAPVAGDRDHVLLPLSFKAAFNNYGATATDVPGKTEKTISFTLPEALTDAAIFLITSNHGANSGGEEYSRRNHFVYFDGSQVLQYKPGSLTCEPFRKYNTQGNGIYGANPKSDAQWQSFSNWCPGDVIPIRRINLGALSAGTHTFKITVPDARFNGGQGDIPLSLYLQGKTSGHLSLSDRSPAATGVRLHPNPADGILMIQTAGLAVSHMDIYNTLGQKMISTARATVNVSLFSPGIYIAHIRLEDGTVVTERLQKN